MNTEIRPAHYIGDVCGNPPAHRDALLESRQPIWMDGYDSGYQDGWMAHERTRTRRLAASDIERIRGEAFAVGGSMGVIVAVVFMLVLIHAFTGGFGA